jgi:hypothetical protein
MIHEKLFSLFCKTYVDYVSTAVHSGSYYVKGHFRLRRNVSIRMRGATTASDEEKNSVAA